MTRLSVSFGPAGRGGGGVAGTLISGSGKRSLASVGNYMILRELGKGNFARVNEAIHTVLKIRVAIKVIDTANVREPYVLKNLTREAKLLAKLQHPSIVCLYETIRGLVHPGFFNGADYSKLSDTLPLWGIPTCRSSYYLVTELATGGDLYTHIKSQPNGHLDEETAKLYARQLVSALEHIHLQGIVHRDLKMENIMLRDSGKRHIKIIDFGLSNWYSGNEQQTHCGSPEYAAPELFHEGRKYGPEVDIWSLGVILYGMMAGQLPFLSPRNDRITVKEWRDKLMSQISRGMTVTQEKKIAATSSGYKDLVKHLLQLQPHKRMPMWQICRHPWINCRDTSTADNPVYPPNGNLDRAELKAISEEISAATKLDPTTVQKELRRYGDITGMFNIIRHRIRGSGSADVFERSSIPSRRPGIGRCLPPEVTSPSPVVNSSPNRRALTIEKSRSKTLTLDIENRGAIDSSKETKKSSSTGNPLRLTCALRNLNSIRTCSRQTEQNSERTNRGLAVGRHSVESSGSSTGSNSSAAPVRPMTQPQLLRSTLARRLSYSLSKMSKDSHARPSCAGDSFVKRDTSYEAFERSIDNKNSFHRQQRHSTPSASQIYRTRSIPKSVVPVVTVRSAAETRERQKIRPQSLEITSELLERAKSFSRPRTSVNGHLNQ